MNDSICIIERTASIALLPLERWILPMRVVECCNDFSNVIYLITMCNLDDQISSNPIRSSHAPFENSIDCMCVHLVGNIDVCYFHASRGLCFDCEGHFDKSFTVIRNEVVESIYECWLEFYILTNNRVIVNVDRRFI